MCILLSVTGILFVITSYAMQPTPITITEETEKFIRNADRGDISYILDALERNPELLRAQDLMGYTALHRAIIRDCKHIAITLISEIQDRYQNLYKHNPVQNPLNIQDPEGNTALHLALKRDYSNLLENEKSSETLIRFLLDNGADPNKKNNYGFTPLWYVMKRYNDDNCESLITLLLNKGADYTILDNQGNTVLSAAQEYVNWLVSRGHVYAYAGRRIELLKKYIHLLEQAQQNPSKELLQEAIKHNFARIVQVLQAAGIPITHDDLELAQQHNSCDVFEIVQNNY